jgi:hypothetical protein
VAVLLFKKENISSIELQKRWAGFREPPAFYGLGPGVHIGGESCTGGQARAKAAPLQALGGFRAAGFAKLSGFISHPLKAQRF